MIPTIWDRQFKKYNSTSHMSLYQALFYAGSELQLIHQDTVGFLGGSSLCLCTLPSMTKDYIMSDRRGFECFATSHKHQLIALAQYGKNPGVIVHHKVKESEFRIQGLAALQIKKMVISMDARYLLVVCGVPDQCIRLYNLEKREKLKGKNDSVKVRSIEGIKLLDVKFNPSNSNQFAVLYSDQLTLYSIDNNYEVTEEEDVIEQNRISLIKEIKAEDSDAFNCIVWDQNNSIYVSSHSRIDYLTTPTLQPLSTHPLKPHAVSSLLLTQKHLIVLYQNGYIQWLNKYYKQLLEDQQHLRPFYLDYYLTISPNVSSALYNHMMTKIFVGHSNGSISVIKLEAEKNSLEEEDEDKGEADGKDKKVKKKDLNGLDTQVLGPFHTKAVTLVKELTSAPVLLSAGRDGNVIFWSLANKNIISYVNIGLEITCGDINKDENVLALGTNHGIVLFYEIVQNLKLSLIYEFKLYESAITQLSFSPLSDELAVISSPQKSIFFILTNPHSRFQVLGYTQVPFQVQSICWNTSNKQSSSHQYPMLFALVGFAILGVAAPEPKAHQRRGDQLKLQTEVTGRKVDPEMARIGVLATGELVVTGRDKILRKYKQPEELLSKMDFKVKAANTPPIEELDGHDLTTNCISFSVKNGELVTGGRDGTIIVRSGEMLSQVKNKIQSHNLASNGVSVVLASNIGRRVYSAGFDGSLFIWALEKMNLTAGYVKKQPLPKGIHKQIESKSLELIPYDQILEKEYLESIKNQVLKKKQQQLAKINHLRQQITKLVKQNETDDQLERLARDEFCIDIETKDQILKQGLVKCEQMRKLSLKENLKREIMAARIKQKTWDKMQIQLKAINGLRLNLLVYNYQVRKRTPSQERRINLVLEMRRQNIKEQKHRRQKGTKEVIEMEWYRNRSVVNGGYPMVLVYGEYEKVEEKKEEKTKKRAKEEEEEKAAKPPAELQAQTDEEWGLLYNAMQLFSSNSKKNQIIMIHNIIFKIKECFNKEFDKEMQFRQQQTEIINEKNKRITEIFEELKRPVELVTAKKNILENPEKVLKVDPSEIGFKRYLSREEKERLEKERLKEEERLRLLAQDDAGQRALGKMMSGTLEEKKESVLEVVIEREKWMDKPIDDMSEDEKMKLKEYEVKKQKAEEEKERTIKKLQAEYRKLKLEIEDILEKYDERLFILFRRKLEYSYRIEQQQLYASKLAVSIIGVDDAQTKLKQLQFERDFRAQQKQKLIKTINSVKNYASEISKLKDQKKTDVKRQAELESRIKNIQKNVFDELRDNEKKRKEMENKWLAKEPELRNIIVPLDPYVGIEQKLLYAHREKEFSTYLEEIKVIQQNFEGGSQHALMNALESRFNLRKQEAELEKRLKSTSDFINQLQSDLNNLTKLEQQSANEIAEYESFLERSKSNIQLQFRLKQGCIEISQDKPIPNLQQALLIPRQAIDDRNDKIIRSANEKINVMEKIKTCKISVTEETLNLEKKLSLANELQQKIKEVQMLKVKKEMQTALAKKDIKMNDTELKNLTEQIENLKKQADKRIAVFQGKIDKINSDIDFIKKENGQLEVQKWNLESTVKQRQKIQQMNGENGASQNEYEAKFQQISTNRKLFDKAKKQTEEIELLREELSKLKAKTFANFSNIQR